MASTEETGSYLCGGSPSRYRLLGSLFNQVKNSWRKFQDVDDRYNQVLEIYQEYMSEHQERLGNDLDEFWKDVR